jgi:hypothetical protein
VHMMHLVCRGWIHHLRVWLLNLTCLPLQTLRRIIVSLFN